MKSLRANKNVLSWLCLKQFLQHSDSYILITGKMVYFLNVLFIAKEEILE